MFMPSIFDNNFVDSFFDDMFTVSARYQRADSTVMKTDVKDLGSEYELDMELPGFAKEDIQAELKDGYLTVKAVSNQTNDEKDSKGNYIRKERYCGTCQRSFKVGDALTQDDIKAAFKDGVLTIRLPKEKEKPAVDERKYITIQ